MSHRPHTGFRVRSLVSATTTIALATAALALVPWSVTASPAFVELASTAGITQAVDAYAPAAASAYARPVEDAYGVDWATPSAEDGARATNVISSYASVLDSLRPTTRREYVAREWYEEVEQAWESETMQQVLEQQNTTTLVAQAMEPVKSSFPVWMAGFFGQKTPKGPLAIAPATRVVTTSMVLVNRMMPNPTPRPPPQRVSRTAVEEKNNPAEWRNSKEYHALFNYLHGTDVASPTNGVEAVLDWKTIEETEWYKKLDFLLCGASDDKMHDVQYFSYPLLATILVSVMAHVIAKKKTNASALLVERVCKAALVHAVVQDEMRATAYANDVAQVEMERTDSLIDQNAPTPAVAQQQQHNSIAQYQLQQQVRLSNNEMSRATNATLRTNTRATQRTPQASLSARVAQVRTEAERVLTRARTEEASRVALVAVAAAQAAAREEEQAEERARLAAVAARRAEEEEEAAEAREAERVRVQRVAQSQPMNRQDFTARLITQANFAGQAASVVLRNRMLAQADMPQ